MVDDAAFIDINNPFIDINNSFILALRLELVIAYQVSEVYSSASVTV